MPRVTNPDLSPEKPHTRLTFGVELEFILATVADGQPNPYPKDPREVNGKKLSDFDPINEDILEKLKQVGIAATVKGVEYHSLPSKEALRTDWILKIDVTVEGNEQGKSYVDYGLEMASPPYFYDEASRKAIETVVRTLRKNYLVRVNNSTGLHVHVGNGYFGLQWKVLRNLMAIAWTYERQIRLIVPRERISMNYCRSLRASSLGTSFPQYTRLEFLNRILSFSSNQDIVSELDAASTGRLGFNIRDLRVPYEVDRRTIEFRQHSGSLDPEAILHWVHVCVKLVERACLTKDDDALYARLRADVEKSIGFGDDEVSITDYLMWLGCPAQAYYYGKQMIANKAQTEQRIRDEAVSTY
ncbi:hypothetical protein MFRU_009g01090 [Monilinia fructicola]|nr:hypothetical protein MFRU_009g01090 [Monilinia fructicola]